MPANDYPFEALAGKTRLFSEDYRYYQEMTIQELCARQQAAIFSMNRQIDRPTGSTGFNYAIESVRIARIILEKVRLANGSR